MDIISKNKIKLKSNRNKNLLIVGVSPVTNLAIGLQGTSFKNTENVISVKNLDIQEDDFKMSPDITPSKNQWAPRGRATSRRSSIPPSPPRSVKPASLRSSRISKPEKKPSSSRRRASMDIVEGINRLLSAGLRVSTPPGRLVPRRLQLVPDENNPLSSPPPLCTRMSRARTPLEDHDPNSQDSGCALSDADSISSFRFAEPCGFPPKRLNSMESPRRSLQFSSFSSDNSCSSTDDGFLDMLSSSPLKTEEENARLPSGLGSLISGQILSENRNSTVSPKRSANFTRRSISENSTPLRRRGLTSLRQEFPLKRPLGDLLQNDNKSPGKENNSKTPICSNNNLERIKRVKSMKDDRERKSAKGTLFHYGFWKETCTESDEEVLAKPVSDKEINIKLALQRSTQEDLIGDFSRPFALPLMTGVHQDLKSISSETLAKLIHGDFKESIESYKIIDCRYPYEYEGGHIKGAINIYTCDDIIRELLEARSTKHTEDKKDKRENVLIFHCEFSSERGPFLSRFLRREDRAGNEYPFLHYPEVYLLHGGYSEFFKTHEPLCEPRSYRAMQDPAHSTELKHFRAKSKSWAPGYHKKQTIRSLTRLQY